MDWTPENKEKPWKITGINYTWKIELVPQVFFYLEKRPNAWVRFWHFVLLGWKYTEMK